MKNLTKEDFENVKNVGELKELLVRFLKEMKTKSVKKTLVNAIVSEVPGLGSVKNVGEVIKKLAVKRPDSERPSNVLGILDLDDEIERILDDKVLEDFLKFLITTLDENYSESAKNWNINIELEDYLKKIYKGRTVTGFNKKRIKTAESVLREYVKNYLI